MELVSEKKKEKSKKAFFFFFSWVSVSSFVTLTFWRNYYSFSKEKRSKKIMLMKLV